MSIARGMLKNKIIWLKHRLGFHSDVLVLADMSSGSGKARKAR